MASVMPPATEQSKDQLTVEQARIIEAALKQYVVAKAEQDALSTVYTVPELGRRLKCGKTKAYELLLAYEEGKEGGIRHKRIGNKYIISEKAVREWLGDLPTAK
jgi:excisionase family DNA binding protein